ncbi:MAG: exo-beta-N-acetylmuramidase NamZ domain-containing protein [Balneolaceae bacterium]
MVLSACAPQPTPGQEPAVETGAQVLLNEYLHELQDKRIGLVMNPTARIGAVHMLDTLLALDVDVQALFAPEHGFRGEAGAGERIEDGVDLGTGLPVFSLYGATRKPTPDMMHDIDLLLFDMQDVGARFYTYHATLGLVLEAAADAEVPVWLLDRPNPAGGEYVSGWMMEDDFRSFVGPYPIPAVHGMTLGELGRMMIGEQWLQTDGVPDFRVIPMRGWNRSMIWPETGLPWVPPSPNLPSFEHAYVYLGTCFVEGTTLSEGRGTSDPFLTLGAPTTDLSDHTLEQLSRQIAGANLERVTFTPVAIPGVAVQPKHEGQESRGIRITITDVEEYQPLESGLLILRELMDATPEAETNRFLYNLTGSREIDEVLQGAEPHFELDDFITRRRAYLLYE